MSATVVRRFVTPLLIAFGGLLILANYFTGNKTLASIQTEYTNWIIILVAFSLTVAMFRTAYNRAREVITRKPGDWPFSVLFLCALTVQLILVLVLGQTNKTYTDIYTAIQISGATAVMATPGLFIVSAAFRTIRARNKEAIVLMTFIILVMIGQTGLGEAIWAGFPAIKDWIWDVPAAGSIRGVALVTAIGLIAAFIRAASGIDRPMGE